MSYRIREAGSVQRVVTEPTLAVLGQVVPAPMWAAVVEAHGVREQRRRKLPADLVLALTVAMHLEPLVSLATVLRRLLASLRLLSADPQADAGLATRSAICQARARLGLRPVVDLF